MNNVNHFNRMHKTLFSITCYDLYVVCTQYEFDLKNFKKYQADFLKVLTGKI